MRGQPSGGLILAPLLLAGLGGCSAVSAVPNENAAIVIFKKQCGDGSGQTQLGPYNQWDAHLEGDRWRVHARSQTFYVGPLPRWDDEYLDVPKDGSPPGTCFGAIME